MARPCLFVYHWSDLDWCQLTSPKMKPPPGVDSKGPQTQEGMLLVLGLIMVAIEKQMFDSV